MHVGIDVKTKQLASIEITTDRTADCSMFDTVLFGAINNTGNAVDTVFADGAHDTENNFEKLHDMKIKAVIPIDSNADTKPPPDTFRQRRRKEPIRRQQARLQLANPKKWRKDNQYGLRWTAETFFSVFKGRHGDYVQAKKYGNMQHELQFKAGLYNQLL